MTRIVVVSGAGDYADPWHPFAETSAELAGIAESLGAEVEVQVDEDVERRLAEPAGADLLVVNIGNPGQREPGVLARMRAGLLHHLGSGRPLLAMHSSITSLLGVPEWEEILGGIWVRGTTMHPPQDLASIRIADVDSAIVRGLADFVIDDERYTDVRVARDVRPLLTHRHDGRDHPLLWFRSYQGARVGVDLLGHDGASYRSPEHRTILARTVQRLLEPPA